MAVCNNWQNTRHHNHTRHTRDRMSGTRKTWSKWGQRDVRRLYCNGWKPNRPNNGTVGETSQMSQQGSDGMIHTGRGMEYPLMATSLSKAQCETIMKPIRRAAALPAIGINWHLTLAIVHGPQRFQGQVRIPDLWTVQGILKLCLALRHGDAPTITDNQLRASME
jgi:hypothetical protein